MYRLSNYRLIIAALFTFVLCESPYAYSLGSDASEPRINCDASEPDCGCSGDCDPIGYHPCFPVSSPGDSSYRNAHSYVYEGYAGRPGRLWGVWLPEGPPLFRPFVADPRQITYSIAWRFKDQVLDKNIIPVSFGDNLALYQWGNVFFSCDELRIEVEGALWATFAPCRESSPLMNADYYGGGVITYAIGDLAFRLRGFHISSHLGDEFLLDHPGFDRRNPSAEYVDLFASYELTNDIRLYAGLGYILHADTSFKMKPFYAAAGAELRLFEWSYIRACDKLYGVPFFAFYWRYSPDFKNHIDMTYALGYEWGKFCGLYRRLRVFLEYHDGYSVEGQFAHLPTNYLQLGASYGF